MAIQHDWHTKHTWHSYWVCQNSMLTDALQQLLHNPNSAFTDNTIQTLKQDKTTDVVVVRCDAQLLVVKRYNLKGVWHCIRRGLSRSRAWRSWHNAHRLIDWGIDTPIPVAYVEQRYGLLRRTAFYITKYVKGHCLSHALPKQAQAMQQAIISHITQILKTIHQHHFVHGDMKSENFLVDTHNRVFLLDLDAMHHPIWQKQRKRLKDRYQLLRDWQNNPTLLTQLTNALTMVDKAS